MKDIRELKCECGATWEEIMWLKFGDVDIENNEVFITEKYECLECGKIIEVEHIATVDKIQRIK